jgi:hypothetical protein
MSRLQALQLSPSDRHRQAVIIAFLKDRLQERATIDWAISIASKDPVKRQAVRTLLDHPGTELREPWLSGWRLIEEFWLRAQSDDGDYSASLIRQRIVRGERSGLLVADLARFVSPRLEVEVASSNRLYGRKFPKRPRTVRDLFQSSLTSNRVRNPAELQLDAVDEPEFLRAVVLALEAAVNDGVEIARRLGWTTDLHRWLAGNVRRVYFVEGQEDGDDRDPDTYATGLAPAVKVLHAVMERLAVVDLQMAKTHIDRWRTGSSVFCRLWAAFAQRDDLIPADQVEAFLLGLDFETFWDVHDFPEFAELRARRFGDLSPPAQDSVVSLIKKGPPRKRWGRSSNPADVEEARVYWAVRELRRIESARGALSDDTREWLMERLVRFPDLAGPINVDEGFIPGTMLHAVTHHPDQIYDGLSGEARLQRLERELATGRQYWDDDDPSGRASAWITDKLNVVLVLADLEAAARAGTAYPLVWERFGWTHSPAEKKDEDGQFLVRNLPDEGLRVLQLLLDVGDDTVLEAIEGISHWMSAWDAIVFNDRNLLPVWRRLWPIGLMATNARGTGESDTDLNIVAQGLTEEPPRDLDTLNSPTGRLVGVFLELWSKTKRKRPFAPGTALQIMRDEIVQADGRGGLIGKHRLIENLIFFQNATPIWTRTHLLPLLLQDTDQALPLWRAVARRRLYTDNIRVLGEALLRRAADPQLARDARKSIVFSIVVECLHAMRAGREPAVPPARIQQLLRSVEEEVRAHAAEAIHRFVKDVPTSKPDGPIVTPEEVYRSAADVFLREVWPQERSLSTPGISQALADIPAAAGDAFSEAVNAIERFIVPFDCWSVMDFGLYGNDEDGEARLAGINTVSKARALLTLLDRSIGTAEGAVVPYDLADALAQIHVVAPSLDARPEYRRLIATTRARG